MRQTYSISILKIIILNRIIKNCNFKSKTVIFVSLDPFEKIQFNVLNLLYLFSEYTISSSVLYLTYLIRACQGLKQSAKPNIIKWKPRRLS